MRPVELAFRMIELLGMHQPIGVSALASLAGIPKTTAQRSLKALEAIGWIEQDGADRTAWRLTLRAALVTTRPSPIETLLRAAALPVMEELRRATEETIHLSALFEARMILVERLDGIRPVRHFLARGQVARLPVTASGKAVLAALPDAEALAIIAEAGGDDEAAAALPAIRAAGYAVTRETFLHGITAIGAAILDRTGRPVCALSISAPSERATPAAIDRWGAKLVSAVDRVGVALASVA